MSVQPESESSESAVRERFTAADWELVDDETLRLSGTETRLFFETPAREQRACRLLVENGLDPGLEESDGSFANALARAHRQLTPELPYGERLSDPVVVATASIPTTYDETLLRQTVRGLTTAGRRADTLHRQLRAVVDAVAESEADPRI